MRLSDLATRLGGTLHGEDREFTGFATDSRHAEPGQIFLAIVGGRVDGASYTPVALERGAVATVAERPVEGTHIVVRRLDEALARFARSFRDGMTGPVVGITGSVGKTTARGFVAAALSPLGEVLTTSGNRNSEWTSPLAWFEGPKDPAAAVIEMGMRGFGQIAHLCTAHAPTVGLITNIGHAHLELVHTREGIARAKGELLEALPTDGVAILPADDDYLDHLRRTAGDRKIFTFGRAEGADVRLIEAHKEGDDLAVLYHVLGKEVSGTLKGPAKTAALAAAMGLAVATACGVSPEDALAKMASVTPEGLRMQLVEHDGRTLLMDAYNAAPESMRAALETLAEYPAQRYALLGAMRELGTHEAEAHRDLVHGLKEYGLDGAMLFAEPMIVAQDALGTTYETTTIIEDARRWLASLPKGSTVLVKGSRAWELERVIA